MVRRWEIWLATAAIVLCLPAAANAAVFCVQKPRCVNAGGTAHATLGSALAAAGANGPARDRVELGPHEFTDGPWSAAAGNAVNVVGSGRTRTTLTRTSTADSQVILALLDEASRLSELTVAVNAGAGVTGVRTPGQVRGVRVVGQTASPSQGGVHLQSGGTLGGSRIAMSPTATGTYAVSLDGPGTAVRRSFLRGSYGLIGSGATGLARGVRLRIIAGSWGAVLSNGVLDQATIRITGAGSGTTGLAVTSLFHDVTTVARHVTVVGANGPNSNGVYVSASGIDPSICPSATAVLRNSIIRRFDTDLFRSAGGCAGSGEAVIDLAWSVFDPLSVVEAGAGEIKERKGNRNVAPRFEDVEAGDYRLRASSPLIDRGRPGPSRAGESKRDVVGRKRVLDGDGDGKARRDIGAFERPRRR